MTIVVLFGDGGGQLLSSLFAGAALSDGGRGCVAAPAAWASRTSAAAEPISIASLSTRAACATMNRRAEARASTQRQ